MGTVGVECNKGERTIDVVLSQRPRRDRLTHTTFLTADEMDPAHAVHL